MGRNWPLYGRGKELSFVDEVPSRNLYLQVSILDERTGLVRMHFRSHEGPVLKVFSYSALVSYPGVALVTSMR